MKTSTKLFNSFINLILDLLFIQKGSWNREKAFFLISSLILIPFNWIRGRRRLSRNVEVQYDQISGSYIQDNYYVDKERYCIVDGNVEFISSIENMKNIRIECNEVLSQLDFSTLLEVGVGELTTIESVVANNKQLTQIFGIDLSLNRMLHGMEEYKKRQKLIPKVSKANATNLPFNDSVFDLVYSRHTLEQMPMIFTAALDEMIRVSRRFIVLFEPSYEKGSLTQKLKMIRNDYFRGLDKFLSGREDIKVNKSFLMRNSANPLNRTSCYVIEKISSASLEEEKYNGFVCPLSKEELIKREGYLFCKKSGLAYPVLEGIPILDKDYSFYIDASEVR